MPRTEIKGYEYIGKGTEDIYFFKKEEVNIHNKTISAPVCFDQRVSPAH